MFEIKKSMTAMAMMASVITPGFASIQNPGPLEDGLSSCGVPVCDMDATLEALAPLTENQRYNYASELIEKNSDTKSIEVLENLVHLSKRLKALSIEKGDADWVIRTISTLGNNAILNLTKYSEIKADSLIELYKQLDTASKRYEVISFYQAQIANMESLTELSELVKFAKLAQSHSIYLEDESWIPRSAAQLASDATVRLVAIDPGHEGIYTINALRTDSRILDVDKIVILDSSSDKNLVVNFINTKHNRIVFSYSEAVIVGDQITGKITTSNTMSSQFELNLNRLSGDVSGKIITTGAGSVTFSANRTFSVNEIYEGVNPEGMLSDKDILGTMNGQIMGIEGSLSIHTFSPNVYTASFVSNRGEIKIDFVGKFFPKKGVIALTHKNKIKLVLSLRKKGDERKWQGASFTITNGKVSKASFTPLF